MDIGSAMTLLALPAVLQRDVLSWVPDSATATALLSTCHTAHHLRRDPSAAAQLLLRCPCRDYTAALNSMVDVHGGTRAVVQQVLQLLQATPESGGPIAAPAPLLQALLLWAVLRDDAGTVRSLMALPHPPDAEADAGHVLRMALCSAMHPHAAVLRVLLESGADPSLPKCPPHNNSLFHRAALSPPLLDNLQLLLEHCPLQGRTVALGQALDGAVISANVPAVTFLLPAAVTAGLDAGRLPVDAVLAGDPAVLRLLLHALPLSSEVLRWATGTAVRCCRPACMEVFLDHGADAQEMLWLLLQERPLPGDPEDRVGMARLLLARGAVVDPGVRAMAAGCGCAALAALLV